jgi:purine-nucleoside phosphorylase
MYRNISPEEYKKYLNLSPDYKVDGLIISGTWNIAKEILILKKSLDDFDNNFDLRKFENNDFLNNGYELRINNKIIWFFVVYGSALASEYVHLSCIFGSKKNILIGSCGGLKKGANSGDILLPTKSKSDGSSCNMYDRTNGKYQFSDEKLRTRLKGQLEKQYSIHEGPTMTCQAMMAETEDDVIDWSRQGYCGVEMESSTVFAVSNHFNVPAAAVLRIADNLVVNETVHSESFQNNKNERIKITQKIYNVSVRELSS